MQASNANGGGIYSAPSNPVTPTGSTPPSTPTGVSAASARSQALVSWGEPVSDGGSPITAYTVTPYIGNAAQTPIEVAASERSALVTGLAQRHALHVHGQRQQRKRRRPALGPDRSGAAGRHDPRTLATRETADSGTGASTEVGVKFSSELAGTITGIRFYKSAANTGTHVGSLWSAGGELLASATFTAESASGWQQVNFSTPVEIAADTTYVAGYLAPAGHYSVTALALAGAPLSNPPLQALASPVSANGVFAESATSTFPTSSGEGNNYWVDVDFLPMALPGQVTNVSASAAPGAANVSWSAPAEGGPVAEYNDHPVRR